MSERIIVGEETFECAPRAAQATREWRRFTISATTAEALAAFVPGAVIGRAWDSAIYDEEGTQTGTEVLTEDLIDYCIVGDVVDHRDGTVSVYIGKKTDAELYQETIDELMLILIGGY